MTDCMNDKNYWFNLFTFIYITVGGGISNNQPPKREKTIKPEGCKKLFAG
jgi:hypothetical protein